MRNLLKIVSALPLVFIYIINAEAAPSRNRNPYANQLIVQLPDARAVSLFASRNMRGPITRVTKEKMLAKLLSAKKVKLLSDTGDSIAIVSASSASRVSRVQKNANAKGLITLGVNAPVRLMNTVPNDPLVSSGNSCGFHNTGLYGWKAGLDISGPQGLPLVSGARQVIVAVIDSGVWAGHPDLQGRVLTNLGYAFGGSLFPSGNNSNDVIGHGTAVSSIIAANTNNREGIAGVATNSLILPLRVIDNRGAGDLAGIAAALNYVINLRQNGYNVRVINASLGTYSYSTALLPLIRRLNELGVVLVAAAGNERNNNDVRPLYPASYGLPNIISVAATDCYGRLASFSNYGRFSVHLAAPGHQIYAAAIPTAGNGAYYRLVSGTSISTPYVSGIAAVVAGKNWWASATDVVTRVVWRNRPLAALANRVAFPGTANLYGAVANVPLQPVP